MWILFFNNNKKSIFISSSSCFLLQLSFCGCGSNQELFLFCTHMYNTYGLITVSQVYPVSWLFSMSNKFFNKKAKEVSISSHVFTNAFHDYWYIYIYATLSVITQFILWLAWTKFFSGTVNVATPYKAMLLRMKHRCYFIITLCCYHIGMRGGLLSRSHISIFSSPFIVLCRTYTKRSQN